MIALRRRTKHPVKRVCRRVDVCRRRAEGLPGYACAQHLLWRGTSRKCKTKDHDVSGHPAQGSAAGNSTFVASGFFLGGGGAAGRYEGGCRRPSRVSTTSLRRQSSAWELDLPSGSSCNPLQGKPRRAAAIVFGRATTVWCFGLLPAPAQSEGDFRITLKKIREHKTGADFRGSIPAAGFQGQFSFSVPPLRIRAVSPVA